VLGDLFWYITTPQSKFTTPLVFFTTPLRNLLHPEIDGFIRWFWDWYSCL